MKIFVINLARRTDRNAFMQEQLDSLGLEAEFIEAYDGAAEGFAGADAYNPTVSARLNGKALTLGELGCAISHRMIYQKMVEQHIDQALILEDDVRLTPAFAALLQNQELLSSRPWSWLQIDYPPVGFAYVRQWVRSTKIEVSRKPYFILYAALKAPYVCFLALYEWLREKSARPHKPGIVYFARPLYLASAYLLTLEAARQLLTLATPIVYPADRLPNQARLLPGFVFRAVIPRLTEQDRSHFISDIG